MRMRSLMSRCLALSMVFLLVGCASKQETYKSYYMNHMRIRDMANDCRRTVELAEQGRMEESIKSFCSGVILGILAAAPQGEMPYDPSDPKDVILHDYLESRRICTPEFYKDTSSKDKSIARQFVLMVEKLPKKAIEDVDTVYVVSGPLMLKSFIHDTYACNVN